MTRLADKTALLTGASRGIGAAIDGSFRPIEAGHWLQSDEPALVAQEILS